MTRETLLEYINNVDEDLIEKVPTEKINKKSEKEVERQSKKNRTSMRTRVIKYISLAACFVVLIGIGTVGLKELKEKENKLAKGENVTFYETDITKKELSGGTEFFYNNTNYKVVESQDFLTSNSLPTAVEKTEMGKCLQNNIGDLQNNTILGDIYEYKGCNDLSVLILKMSDGTYKMAVDEEKYEK